MLPQADGYIHAFDKEAQNIEGFPLRLQGDISNDLLLRKGAGLEDTEITCLSDQGELVQFNLQGNILARQQLFKASNKGRFVLCVDPKTESWVIAYIDLGQTILFDARGEKLFELPYGEREMFEVQFFQFENDLKIIAITDQAKAETYLYNWLGEPLGEPIHSTQKIHMDYDELRGQLVILKSYSKEVKKIGLEVD